MTNIVQYILSNKKIIHAKMQRFAGGGGGVTNTFRDILKVSEYV